MNNSDLPPPASCSAAPAAPECNRLAAELSAIAPGQVRFDRHHRMLYSTDASIYQIEPIGVVLPRDVETMAAAVKHCAAAGVPVLMRGGGTSLAGQCVNRAVVIDHSMFCRRVLSLDAAARVVHVEPGLTVDELNAWLDQQGAGLFFAPDPATSAQASIGGCIGNNAAGARSIRYGRTSENVAALEVLLADGRRTWLGPGAGRRDAAALELARGVADIVARHADLIRQRFPKTSRRNAGYALDAVLAQLDRGAGPEDIDLTGLLCGSEGTLAVTLSAKLKLHPVPRSRGLAIVSFASPADAIQAVTACVATGAAAVELLDDVVLEAARGNAECRRYMDLLQPVDGRPPQAVLYVEYQETGAIDEVHARFARLKEALGSTPMRTYVDRTSQARAWALRKAGEPLLHALSGRRKPVTGVEDNAVPVENLVRFVEGFKQIVARHGTKAAYYAHASVGVLHVRPLLDLHDPADRDRLRSIAVEVADLAKECGGVMSGEHGDGRIRGPLLQRYFGPELMQAFRQVKRLFDPAGVLNPGMIVDPGPVESITANLRVAPCGTELRWAPVDSFFGYADYHAFQEAVETCNGAGVCRRMAPGVMCPSYRATLDERHSTRGRANALRLALTGQLGNSGHDDASPWNDPETIATLDLCLSCKACRTECPSSVDLARLKAEYTAQRYRQHGAPLRARLFGHIGRLNRLASALPALANAVASLPPVRAVMNRLLHLAPQRSLPRFAPSLYRWFARRQRPSDDAARPRVVLFGDCFVAYNDVHVGRAAVALLEHLGYAVELPRVACCGRAMISNGLLDDAIRSADAALAALRPYLDDARVRAVVVCEPSCLATMKDEWLSLRLSADIALRRRMAEMAIMVDEFVERFWNEHPRRPELPTAAAGPKVLMHGHCHQKAVWGEQTSAAAIRRVVGDRLTVLPSGCCGMAGAFGYDRGRYELSMKIGEQSLFRLLRDEPPDAVVLAAGTSCRHQIKDGTGRTALHPVELLAQLLGAPVE